MTSLSQGPGFAGTFNAAQFAALVAATYTGQWCYVDDGTRLTPYRSTGVEWVSMDLTAAQIAAGATGVAGATSGAPGTLILPGGEVRLTTPQYTWATLPAAAAYIGNAFVSDVGARGSLWRSDGSAWGLVNGQCVLTSTAVAAAAHTGTVAETTIATYTLPAGLLGLNGVLEIYSKWTLTNNANAKTFTPKLSSTTLGGIGMPSAASFGTRHAIQNRNSASSQLASNGTVHGYSGNGATGWTLPAVDTSVAQNITLNITLGVAGDSATLESYEIILRRP